MRRFNSRNVFIFCNYTFITAIAVVMFYPMWYVICAAFSNSTALARHTGILLLPQEFSFAAFKMMFRNPMITRGFLNTVIIVTTATVVNLIFTSITAYVLSRKNVLWNKFFNKFVIFTMFFNGGMIPTYIVVTKILNLDDSWLSLILPGAINVYNMIIMRTSFAAIPDALEEAAIIDGASRWTVLIKVILPLSKAVIAVMVLYYAVGHWNAWFNASIYIKDREKFPVQLILREILIANDTSNMTMGTAASDQVEIGEIVKYATIVTTTIPILIVYPFLQKYFVGGVMIGAVKG